MFEFCNLYSGSSGNCSFLHSDNTKVLIDCGVSMKKIATALASMNIDINDINGILVTHEHSDHISSLAMICKKYNIPIFANSKTFDNINQDIPDELKNTFNTNEKFEIGDLNVLPFHIPHDAADPCGFSISYNNKKISIATDIGHMENSIIDNLCGSSFVLLESNYEPNMLQYSRYPYYLKKRIIGPNGHLSNAEAGNTICSLIKNGVNNISLGHLSKSNNFPELAYQTVMNTVISNKVDMSDLNLSVSHRDKVDNIINIV